MDGCLSVGPRKYEWALEKGHSYSDDPKDYLQLCPSCHRKYDLTPELIKKHSDRLIGETHNSAKLTNADVFAIYDMINQGISLQDIARNFSIHSSTVSNIKTGKRWGHLLAQRNSLPSSPSNSK
jgi:hypothetical protein